MSVRVKFLPGDGTEQFIEIELISNYPRGPEGTCAFCLGDPCCETSSSESLIGQYTLRRVAETGHEPETCPLCDGRPS